MNGDNNSIWIQATACGDAGRLGDVVPWSWSSLHAAAPIQLIHFPDLHCTILHYLFYTNYLKKYFDYEWGRRFNLDTSGGLWRCRDEWGRCPPEIWPSPHAAAPIQLIHSPDLHYTILQYLFYSNYFKNYFDYEMGTRIEFGYKRRLVEMPGWWGTLSPRNLAMTACCRPNSMIFLARLALYYIALFILL